MTVQPADFQVRNYPASAALFARFGLTIAIDAHESDAYLSDAQGRRVTPRVTADSSRADAPSSAGRNGSGSVVANSPARGRGRPPKAQSEKDQQAREAQERLVAQKKRVGGPGIDRGGATFANDKRRKGFSDDDQTEEEFVDAEE